MSFEITPDQLLIMCKQPHFTHFRQFVYFANPTSPLQVIVVTR